MDNLISEYSPLAVRLTTALSCLVFSLAGFINFWQYAFNDYSLALLSLLVFCFGVVGLLCEFSPFGLNLLMTAMPFLGEYRFRGVFYILLGLFPLGDQMQWFGKTGGALMMFSGFLNVLMHFIGPLTPAAMGYDDPNNGPVAGFQRFDEYEDIEGHAER